jgi:cellulose/xylan binding protein with CBM9 domain
VVPATIAVLIVSEAVPTSTSSGYARIRLVGGDALYQKIVAQNYERRAGQRLCGSASARARQERGREAHRDDDDRRPASTTRRPVFPSSAAMRATYALMKQRCIRYHVTLDSAPARRGSAFSIIDAMNLPRLSAAWLLVPLVLFIPNICFGQDVAQLTAGRLAGDAPPQVDGRVDDEAWSAALPYSSFTQQEPNDGEAATERTEIRFLIDPQNLYVGIISFDSEPDKIIVSQSRRDADLSDTDSIEVLLDTFNDGQNAFVFGTNPFGIEYDGQVTGEAQAGRRIF